MTQRSRLLRPALIGSTAAALTLAGAGAALAVAAAPSTSHGQTVYDPATSVTPPASRVVDGKIQICHRTDSTSNPYVLITIAIEAADGIASRGRGDHFMLHAGPVWDPSLPNRGNWGDIIPPIAGVHEGLNWDRTGRAIWMQGCFGEVFGDSDNDGVPNTRDSDDDNDGRSDVSDTDDDGDGITDGRDVDKNGDGVTDDTTPDQDRDGTPDTSDSDDDNDGTPDTEDRDRDNDGDPDAHDPDADGDGVPDFFDTDRDEDGITDSVDPDDDNDGIRDQQDPDDDNDGLKDPVDPNTIPEFDPPRSADPDSDDDGTRDRSDSDDDNDSIVDPVDPDENGDGTYERFTTDTRERVPAERTIESGERLVVGTAGMRATSGAKVKISATCLPTSTGVARAVPTGDAALTCVCTITSKRGKLILRVFGAPSANVVLNYWAPAAGPYDVMSKYVRVIVE